MKKTYNQIYQFKITLKDIKPPVWRRIQVPETYSFWDLHVAIQDAFGWTDCHLHQFVFGSRNSNAFKTIGIPDEDIPMSRNEVLAGWDQNISKWFTLEKPRATYSYDFGDDWRHEVELEKIIPREKDLKYPRCTDGKRACPPEDCGGISGYEELICAIKDPRHSQHEELIEWVGGEYDPERFNAIEVCFDNPKKRLKMCLA